jgi:hypothetical protein
MVSLPDDLLHAIDAEAARRGTTRSGLLRAYVDVGMNDRVRQRRARMRALNRAAAGHGGDVAALVKRLRPR